MNEVIQILMHRDGLSKSDAIAEVKTFIAWLRGNVESLSLCEIEEEFLCTFGLEPDYVMDFICAIS